LTVCGNDHRLDHIALLDVFAADGVLDVATDDVADPGVPAGGAASTRMQRISLAPVLSATRASTPAGSLRLSRISTIRHRFVADSGRVSMINTRSPTPALFAASCAATCWCGAALAVTAGCLTRSSTATTTVLVHLSLTT